MSDFKVTITWQIEDVKSLDDSLTDDECIEVLRAFERNHDGSMESMWQDLRFHLDELKSTKSIRELIR